jgi:hypothetical protein
MRKLPPIAMGMFDNLTCEYPLPAEPNPDDNSFQTKDFECQLEHYTITADGRLLRKDTAVQYHGVIRFYTYTGEMWFEYEAKFADGNLIDIRALSICKDVDRATRVVLYPSADEHG